MSIVYPGASAQVVADTVAAPIEQQVNGVEGMLYMSSQMGNDGSYTLDGHLRRGHRSEHGAGDGAEPRGAGHAASCPRRCRTRASAIRKRTPDILMIVNLFSPNGRYDDIYLSNFATINVRDELLRVDGVSDVIIFGAARLQHPRLARSAEDGLLRP